MSNINAIKADKEFMNWLKKNFFLFLPKEKVIERYINYLLTNSEKGEKELDQLYSVYNGTL